jgi:radical SAM protein with 4Fe4S-binding SPASM domain
MKRAKGNMTIDTFRSVMEQFGKDIFFLLIYHQGEPYINPHFLNFVKLAKEKNIYVTTSTNGHYFTDENIDMTIDSGLDSMIVSVDGITQESYAKYRVRGKLDKVLDGTRKLMLRKTEKRSRTPNVALQFLVMKHNEHEIPQIKKLAKELGVDRLLIKNIEVHSVEQANEWLPADDIYRRYDFDGNQLVVKGIEKNSCTRPWLSTLVNWDGEIVPCCFDKNGNYPMGNIANGNTLAEIWRGQSFSEFRSKLLKDRQSIDICSNCNQGFGSFLPKRKWQKSKKD